MKRTSILVLIAAVSFAGQTTAPPKSDPAKAKTQAPAQVPPAPSRTTPTPAGAKPAKPAEEHSPPGAAGKGAPAPTTPAVVKALKFPPLREVKIPEVATFTLSNGMRVYMLENHELPLVSGFAMVRTGNLFEPKDKIGLAGMTGSVIRTGGTKTRTGDQLDETLENIAASVESGIGETSGTVSFNTLKENLDEVLPIFKDVLTNPEFRQDKVDLIKTQTRSGISRRNDDAHGIAGREFASIVYGRENPYGWEMEYEHVDSIKREDMVAFYRRYFFPANVMLAVSGDFSTADMKAKLEKLFADWTVKAEPILPFPSVTNPQSTGVYLGVKDDVTQTFFTLGHLGGVLKDADYPALSVMSDILGGGFSSRLFTNVRTKQGLAYSVGGGWGTNYGHPGLFRIAGSTKSASTVDALQASIKEIERIRTAEVTDQELETAKQSVLNSFVFFFDHPNKILNRYVTYEYWNYPKDFIFQYQAAVRKVTKADVLRVAKEHLHPDKMAIVAVGNPKEFGKPLSTLGTVKTLDLTIPEPKQQVSKADPASLAKGKAMFERAQKAIGGAEKLAAIKDMTMTSNVAISPPQGGAVQVKQLTQWAAPQVMRQTQELPFGKVIVFFDGKAGWLQTPQGNVPMPPPVIKQVQGEAFRNLFNLWSTSAGKTINAVAEDTIEITGAGESVRVTFDPASGLPSKYSYQSAGGMGGGPAQVVTTYSDWRDTSGVKMPYKVLIEQNGQKFAEGTISEVKLNSGLTVEELSKKP